MKGVFLAFHGLADYNGISKKIAYQVKAFKDNGVDMKLCYTNITDNGEQHRMIDDVILENFGAGLVGKIKKRVCFDRLTSHIIDNGIDILYIRSAHNADPFITRMTRKVHNAGVKVVMEIPTYPYEGQFKGAPLKQKLRLLIDIVCRKSMAKHLDRIITFTDLPEIFSVPTVSISNGIDFDTVKLKNKVNDTTECLNFIAVAELHYWHGFDRMIRGISEYYSKQRDLDVKFHIVGAGFGDEYFKLKKLVEILGLENRVVFYGNLSGTDLDDVFEISDMGIASLARHRSGITHIKTLKNREYAARGIAFAYSEIDDDFEDMPYVYKAEPNETPIDVEALIAFYKNQTLVPYQIRSSIEGTLSWKCQIAKVLNGTFLIDC